MENVFTTVKYFCVFSNYLGVFPLAIEGNCEKGSFKHKWQGVIISLFIGIFTAVSSICVITLADAPVTSSSLLSRAWVVIISFNLAMVFLSWIYQHLKHKNIPKFLKTVHKFDSQVRCELKAVNKKFNYLHFFIRLLVSAMDMLTIKSIANF